MKPQQAPEDTNSNQEQVQVENSQLDKTEISEKKHKLYTIIALIIISVVCVGSIILLFFYTNNTKSESSTTTKDSTTANQQNSTQVSIIPDSINPIDETKLPLGVNKYTSVGPKKGYIYSCQSRFSANAGGADVAGPWINESSKTWNSKQKVSVSGSVKWPNAKYQNTLSGDSRNIVANNLPINNQSTGIFPIASSDAAYQYDKNPNSIASQNINWTLPVNPTILSTPKCLNMGAVGILEDGVVLFNALDGEGRDAAAYETLDSCEGHPERTSEYHHHNIASCIIAKYASPNSSSLVGYATDGYGIYVERDKNGKLLTNDNLDECHGRTSQVLWDGKTINMYHYNATLEFPYTIGCFKANPAVSSTQSQPVNRPLGPPRN